MEICRRLLQPLQSIKGETKRAAESSCHDQLNNSAGFGALPDLFWSVLIFVYFVTSPLFSCVFLRLCKVSKDQQGTVEKFRDLR